MAVQMDDLNIRYDVDEKDSQRYLPVEEEANLQLVASILSEPGKGILSADEPPSASTSLYAKIGLDNNDGVRRIFRQLMFTCDNQIGDMLSGVTLQEEGFMQHADNGMTFPRLLNHLGVYPGIRLDTGLILLPNSKSEFCTEGIDNLSHRCISFRQLGAKFGKWRSVFKICDQTPSMHAILENCSTMGRFAVTCQQHGLVPLLHAEVLSEGSHSLSKCQRVTEMILAGVMKSMHDHHVYLEGLLLQTNMITAGNMCVNTNYSEKHVAAATIHTLTRVVPPAVQGIFFASGSQQDAQATMNLNAINKLYSKKPWSLSYSFGRAIQQPVLGVWKGQAENEQTAKQELVKILKLNSSATLGKLISKEAANKKNTALQAYHMI